MPRKVNIELEASLRMQAADKKKELSLEQITKEFIAKRHQLEAKEKEALEAIETKYQARLAKTEVWKSKELTIQQDSLAQKAKLVAPRIRRTKEEIETEQLKAELKRKNDESYRRHQEKKAQGEIPETHTDRENSEILSGLGALFESGDRSEEEEEEEDDMWDCSGMTEKYKAQYLNSKLKQGEVPPQFILEWLSNYEMQGLEVKSTPITSSNPVPEFEAATKNLEPPEPKLDTTPNPLTDPPAILGLCKPFSVMPQTSERLPDKMPPLITNTKVKKLVKQVLNR